MSDNRNHLVNKDRTRTACGAPIPSIEDEIKFWMSVNPFSEPLKCPDCLKLMREGKLE
jgi:hypothetical protein